MKWTLARSAARTILSGAVRLMFPNGCACCGLGGAAESLCGDCRVQLSQTAATPVCPRCAGTAGPFAGSGRGCDLCHRDRFAFERVVRLGAYVGPLAKACRHIKHLNGYRLAVALADLLYEHRQAELAALGIDVVVPAPLHWWRRLRRRYDQATVLAERLGRRLDRPVMNDLLCRRRATPPQTQLSPTQRRANLRNAFVVRKGRNVAGRSVLLVDDVLTTGATCHEAARVLRAAGAPRIVVAVIARGEGTRRS